MDYGTIRGCMVTALGWTFDQCNQTAFSDVLALFDYWNECPPVHMLVRGYLGYEGKKSSKKNYGNPTDMDRKMVAQMPGVPLDSLPDYRRDAINRLLREQKAEKETV